VHYILVATSLVVTQSCSRHFQMSAEDILYLRHIAKLQLWKTGLLPLTTRVSDVFSGFPIQPMQLLLKYDSELALHRSCCRLSKQDGSVSLGTWHGWAIRKTRPQPYIRRFAGYPRTGGAAQDVHVAPGYGPWKQTSSRSITV